MKVKFKSYLPCTTALVKKKTEDSAEYYFFSSKTKIVRAHSCKLISADL